MKESGAPAVATSPHLAVHDPSLDPLEAGAPDEGSKRRRGRPFGSKTRAVDDRITADEFAVLRAVAQGVDVGQASRQYLVFPGRTPELAKLQLNYRRLLTRVEASARSIQDPQILAQAKRYLRDLVNLQTVVTSDVQLADASVAPAPAAGTSAALQGRVEPSAPAQASPGRPTLEQFAQQFDEDMYSEHELMELYQEAYPAPSGEQLPLEPDLVVQEVASRPIPQSIEQRPIAAQAVHSLSAAERIALLLQAIDWLDANLGRKPNADDAIDVWLRIKPGEDDPQRKAFEQAGVLTLGDLVGWINIRPDWYAAIPGYGVRRAEDIVGWLARWELKTSSGLGLQKHGSVGRAPLGQSHSASHALIVSPAPEPSPTHLQPLTIETWPPQLLGFAGDFRKFGPNTMEATNDLEAMAGWYRIIKQKSPSTQRAYRRAVERLAIWAVYEKEKCLSSLSLNDLLDFKAFLLDPPPHWIQEEKTARSGRTASWRPLRGKLSDKSMEVTFVAISSLYDTWLKTGYITADPSHGIVGTSRKDESMDVMRSFSDQQLEVIARTFSAMTDGAKKTRLVAIIGMLEASGLRREELQNATWAHLSPMRIDGRDTDRMELDVLGKGKRRRKVPISAPTLEALQRHLQDRLDRQARGVLTPPALAENEGLPLIGVLDERWISAHNKRLDMQIEAQILAGHPVPLRETVNANGGLSGASIYMLIKSFFKDCSRAAGESELDRHTPFKRASTHWLRHTFAHHILRATDKDLTVVQALLGHANINTSALYVKADMADRAAAVDTVTPAAFRGA